jgi:hypothetical protein
MKKATRQFLGIKTQFRVDGGLALLVVGGAIGSIGGARVSEDCHNDLASMSRPAAALIIYFEGASVTASAASLNARARSSMLLCLPGAIIVSSQNFAAINAYAHLQSMRGIHRKVFLDAGDARRWAIYQAELRAAQIKYRERARSA